MKMKNLFDITKKVIVITGGTGILGRHVAAYLAEQGAVVVIMGRNSGIGEDIVNCIRTSGGRAMFLETDVMNRKRLEHNLKTIMAKFGQVDALLNAAGGNMPGATIPPGSTIFDIDTEDFKKVLDLNLIGTVLPTQVFLKPMAERGKGAIVNFTSMAAFRPLTRVAGYGVAKAGVTNYTEFMAAEVAKKFSPAIRVNAIAPGFFLTEQNRTLLTNEDGSLTSRGKDIVKATPVARFGRSDEVCGAVHYLCSDASSFVTGTVMAIDGGFSCFSGV